MRARYTESFKRQAVEKTLSRADATTLAEITDSLGIGNSTLNKWMVKSRNQQLGSDSEHASANISRVRKEKRPQDWRQEERLEMEIECGFCVAAAATFRLLYILVVMAHGTRKILHCNVTANPTVEWTLHQLREAFPSDHERRVIHDGDSIFSQALDKSISNLRLLKALYRAPQATSISKD